MRLSDLYW